MSFGVELFSADSIRDGDSRAIHVLGVPSTLLMTNAAKHLANAAAELMGKNKSAAVFCGSGNNGGDGVACAMYLQRRGVNVRCYFAGNRSKISQDCAEMERRFVELGGNPQQFDPQSQETWNFISRCGVIVDALFGIGLNCEINGLELEAVRAMNRSGVPIISADIASGVQADTGKILGEAVCADLTVTFSKPKIGHFAQPGCTCCGELKVVDIGIPAEFFSGGETGVFAVDGSKISLPKRQKLTHKGDYGRLLIVGGSVGYTGAPVLCARAAARSGAGLISLALPESIYPLTAQRLLEPMPFPLPDDGQGKIGIAALSTLIEKVSESDVCVLGCGLSRSEELTGLVRTVVCSSSKQLLLDADALFALGNDPEIIKHAPNSPILTPHEGEFLRLGGTLSGDRVADARSFAMERNCVLVLKGHRTVCAFPDGEVYIIQHGNAGMAKGGTGDVLAGILGAMLCQLPVKQAVLTGCTIHAMAGDACAESLGEYSMLPTDIIETIPQIMKGMTKAQTARGSI